MIKANNNERTLKMALLLLNHKDKLEILYYLNTKKMRFGEIKNNLNTITQQLLTKHLKQMIKDNLISRKQFSGFPRKVEYSLTPLGRSLKPLINQIVRWEKSNFKIINKIIKKNKYDSLFDYY